MITYKLAKEYLGNGWSVIPVFLTLDAEGKVQKKPAIAWREYQERRPTDEELHKWFDTPKYNGIGLITGKISHMVVVDVDSIENKDFYSPMTAKTISGGWHLYYRWEEEIRNDAGISDKPLDFRGDGGFVVLPGSGIGDQVYTWHTNPGTMFLTPLPDDLKKLLKIRKKESVSSHVAEKGVESLNNLPVAKEGSRNNIAAQVAGIICKGVSKRLLKTFGYRIFSSWNKTNCSPSLPEQELQRTWESIYGLELQNNPEKEVGHNIFTGQEAMAQHKKLQEEYGQGISTGFSSLDNFFTFLPEQLYLLSAPTHQGKTTLALNIAARVAAYGENVLFCSLEQGVFIAPRVEAMLQGDFPDSLSILTSDKMLNIEQLTTIITEMKNKPRVVMVDHLHFIQKQGRGITEDVDDMILGLQNMAKTLRLPVLVVAHVRKLNSDRVPELDDLRDSSSLSQVPSVVILLHRKKVSSAEDMQRTGSYLEPIGKLFIAKNRIQGKTGVLSFKLEHSGEVKFP